jgi:DNA-directed RNA polymerase subunit RPC12/RpoP
MILLDFKCHKCGKHATVAPSEEAIRYSEEKSLESEETKNVAARCPYCGTWNTVKVPKSFREP